MVSASFARSLRADTCVQKPAHPYLCAFHARKDARALAAEAAGEEITYHPSGSYVSACDLSSALSPKRFG
jgi:hypothetical protein